MLVSFMGSGIQDVAVPLFVLDLTGSGTAMGTFMIITAVPRLVLYPLAGVLGDRVNRKHIMVSMDIGRGITVFILAFFASKNILGLPVLFAAQFVISLMNALFGPSATAMLPDIVDEKDLVKANSITEMVSSFSYIVGPVLGGIIYGLGGVKAAFLINGISFMGSGICEMFIVYFQKTKKLENIREVADDLVEGITFIRNHTGLLILLEVGLIINFLVGPLLMVLIPYVMRVVIKFSAEQYGLLQTAFMGGLLLGNFIIGILLAKTRVEKILTKGFFIQVAVMAGFVTVLFPSVLEWFDYASWTLFFVVFCIFLIMGVSSALVNTPIGVGFQKLAPTEVRARVFSVSGVVIQGVTPIGYGIMGILLDIVPVHVIALAIVLGEGVVITLFVVKYMQKVATELEKTSELGKHSDRQ